MVPNHCWLLVVVLAFWFMLLNSSLWFFSFASWMIHLTLTSWPDWPMVCPAVTSEKSAAVQPSQESWCQSTLTSLQMTSTKTGQMTMAVSMVSSHIFVIGILELVCHRRHWWGAFHYKFQHNY